MEKRAPNPPTQEEIAPPFEEKFMVRAAAAFDRKAEKRSESPCRNIIAPSTMNQTTQKEAQKVNSEGSIVEGKII